MKRLYLTLLPALLPLCGAVGLAGLSSFLPMEADLRVACAVCLCLCGGLCGALYGCAFSPRWGAAVLRAAVLFAAVHALLLASLVPRLLLPLPLLLPPLLFAVPLVPAAWWSAALYRAVQRFRVERREADTLAEQG